MRIVLILLVVCFLSAGLVSALPLNPAALPAKAATSPPTAVPIPVVSHVIPAALITETLVTLSVNSVPAGAVITVDGEATSRGTTPARFALRPGSHTIVLTLDSYQDYPTTVSLVAGSPATVVARLQPVAGTPATIQPEVVQAAKTILTFSSTTMVQTVIQTAAASQPSVRVSAAPSPQGPRVLGIQRQAGVIDSVLGFFGGLFRPACPPGTAACGGGRCIDLMNDSENCGVCGYTCIDTATCQNGECIETPSMASSLHDVGAVVKAPGSCNYTLVHKWGEYGTGDGKFENPSGIAVWRYGSEYGDVYVTDTGSGRVQEFDLNGTFIRNKNPGLFSRPTGIAMSPSVGVWVIVADMGFNRIDKVLPDTGTNVEQWGHIGWDNGEFRSPFGVAADGSGYVYVTEIDNNRVQKFDKNGAYVTKWGEPGNSPGHFNSPHGIAVDHDGYVYVTDTLNNRIQKFDHNGVLIRLWGEGGSGDGQFILPTGIAVDHDGYVYVTDRNNNRVQKFDANGEYITQWGQEGDGYGQFIHPAGIAVDRDGYVYVVDAGNYRIQKFDCE